MMAQSLEALLDTIPTERLPSLNHKIKDGPILANVARTIPDWPIAANFFRGIDSSHVQAIKYNNPLSLHQQQISLLQKWRQRNGSEATYRALAKCLYAAGAVDSVHMLCMEFGALASDVPASSAAPGAVPDTSDPNVTVPQQSPRLPAVSVDLQNFKKTVERGDRVDVVALQRFSTPSQTINILQRVGSNYKPMLGNILLRSHNGGRVRSCEMTHHGDVDQVVYDIFQKWCTEDDTCTWGQLVLHLRAANLNPLANDIDSVLI